VKGPAIAGLETLMDRRTFGHDPDGRRTYHRGVFRSKSQARMPIARQGWEGWRELSSPTDHLRIGGTPTLILPRKGEGIYMTAE
jgi:hypothetical protein